VKGFADLDDVRTALGWEVTGVYQARIFPSLTRLTFSDDSLRGFGTLSGFLCHQAGEIPNVVRVMLDVN
jgi:hypothetical protein